MYRAENYSAKNLKANGIEFTAFDNIFHIQKLIFESQQIIF